MENKDLVEIYRKKYEGLSFVELTAKLEEVCNARDVVLKAYNENLTKSGETREETLALNEEEIELVYMGVDIESQKKAIDELLASLSFDIGRAYEIDGEPEMKHYSELTLDELNFAKRDLECRIGEIIEDIRVGIVSRREGDIEISELEAQLKIVENLISEKNSSSNQQQM